MLEDMVQVAILLIVGIVGHWYVLATLTAIIVLFLAMDYFTIKKGRIRDSMV